MVQCCICQEYIIIHSLWFVTSTAVEQIPWGLGSTIVYYLPTSFKEDLHQGMNADFAFTAGDSEDMIYICNSSNSG